jgi:hypothetical protein
MGGTKGSGTNTNFFGSGRGGYGQGNQSMSSMMNNPLGMINTVMMSLSPEYAKKFGGPQNMMGGNTEAQRQPAMTMPAMPEYVNYQQAPVYSSQPAQPSQAILDFQASNYASGGAAKEPTSDDQIEAALRIVRLLGELNKKL